MNKQEFIAKLRAKLSGLPKQDVEERLNFYSEMIDDRMEEGLSEEEAVSQIGSVDEIVPQIVAEIPADKIAKKKTKSKRPIKAWEIVLLALGSPVWFSLAVAAVAVIFSLYGSLWSVVISLWAVFGSLVGSAFGVAVAGVVFICQGNALAGIAIIGTGIVCAGIAIFIFFGCKAATKGTFLLIKVCALGIKKCFAKKEEA